MQQQSYQNALKSHKDHWWWKSRKKIFSTLLRKYLKKKNIKILDFWIWYWVKFKHANKIW